MLGALALAAYLCVTFRELAHYCFTILVFGIVTRNCAVQPASSVLVLRIQPRDDSSLVEAVMLPKALSKHVVSILTGSVMLCAQRDCFTVGAFLAQSALADVSRFAV